MKRILITNQKGGVGKSLLADCIAFSLERAQVPYNFYDLDNQGGTIHGTTIPEREDAVAEIIDTPGALSEDVSEWMKAADVIIIPFRPTSRDIPPLLKMIDIADIFAPKKPVLYVLNGWNRYKAAKDFGEWFSETMVGRENFLVMELPQSELFVQASAAGVSIVDYAPKSTAAEKMRAVTNWVRKQIDVKTEEM